eukprot:333796-Pleurochrysis_carterae.AAC.1
MKFSYATFGQTACDIQNHHTNSWMGELPFGKTCILCGVESRDKCRKAQRKTDPPPKPTYSQKPTYTTCLKNYVTYLYKPPKD